MIEDTWSFSIQMRMANVLRYKVRLVFAIVLFLNTILLSAQQSYPQQKTDSEPVITVLGEAVIYSKDEAFNKQIRNNKNLQSHSNIEISANSSLKISAKKVEKKTKTPASYQKKKRNKSLSTREEIEKKHQSSLPKKEIEIRINSKDGTTAFFSDSSNQHISFIPPNNDYSPSRFLTESCFYQKRTSVKFWNHIDYFYKNINFKQQTTLSKFSVRPPPALLS